MKNRSSFNPDVHHRRSIRFPEYDYAQPGFYFITICVQDRLCLFGEVIDGCMILNEAGTMIQKWYDELRNKYPDKKCHTMIVMPNHFHCIIENDPENYIWEPVSNQGAHVGAPLRGHPDTELNETSTELRYGPTNQQYNATIGLAIDWFKTMTTNAYIRGVKELNWEPFNRRLWQRNYWEHIIRNYDSYENISNYIINNPLTWQEDQLNPNHPNPF